MQEGVVVAVQTQALVGQLVLAAAAASAAAAEFQDLQTAQGAKVPEL